MSTRTRIGQSLTIGRSIFDNSRFSIFDNWQVNLWQLAGQSLTIREKRFKDFHQLLKIDPPVKLSNVSVQHKRSMSAMVYHPHHLWLQKTQDQQTYAMVPNHQWILQQWPHLANVPIWSMTPFTNDSFSQWPPFTNDPKQPMPPFNQWPLSTNNPIQPMSPFSQWPTFTNDSVNGPLSANDPHSPMTLFTNGTIKSPVMHRFMLVCGL